MRLTQYMLSEEQQEAASVIVNGPTMLLYHTNTLDDVGQAELFATGQERYPLSGQELFETRGDLFGDCFRLAIVREICV